MNKLLKKIVILTLLIATFVSVMPVSAAYDSRNNGRYNNNGTVGFFIQINGEQLDKEGNVSGRDAKFFTSLLGKTTLKQNLNNKFTLVAGNGVTSDTIVSYVNSVPNEDEMFKSVAVEYQAKDAFIRSSNGKVIPWSRLCEDYYKVQWYVLKKEDDFWHIDGVIVEKETNKEISIVVPEPAAERASCIEFDVKKGTYTPGLMKVKANRPHSVWKGDNNTMIMEGFEDVWYTVLDENTFEANSFVLPQELINAAVAVNKLAGARLSELDKNLQRQYGRIDSQAYKQEYVARNGLTTLYVTPFISERLSSKYGVDTDRYIWLAMGDSQGNVAKVYVMDRKTADVDNLFEKE